MKLIALKKEMGFTVPYMFLNIETAKTLLKDAIHSQQKEYSDDELNDSRNASKDWELWLVGEYNTETGEIESFPTPIGKFNEVVYGIK